MKPLCPSFFKKLFFTKPANNVTDELIKPTGELPNLVNPDKYKETIAFQHLILNKAWDQYKALEYDMSNRQINQMKTLMWFAVITLTALFAYIEPNSISYLSWIKITLWGLSTIAAVSVLFIGLIFFFPKVSGDPITDYRKNMQYVIQSYDERKEIMQLDQMIEYLQESIIEQRQISFYRGNLMSIASLLTASSMLSGVMFAVLFTL